MWVTYRSYVGHIWIVLWVSGSNGSTGVTHFQPCLQYRVNLVSMHIIKSRQELLESLIFNVYNCITMYIVAAGT